MGLKQVQREPVTSWPWDSTCYWIRDGSRHIHCAYCNSNLVNIVFKRQGNPVCHCLSCNARGMPGGIPSPFPSEVEMATGWAADIQDTVWFSPFNPSPGGFPGYVEHDAQQWHLFYNCNIDGAIDGAKP